jgi:transcriptional regulator with XRE-family HTH domain
MQAEAFRQWREGTGYTQAAAAARFFKVTRATLQNWETGATPIPAAVETACQIWGRRVRQEQAGYGPVTLVYSDGPMFRDPYEPQQRQPMMHQEQYDMNAQAITRVCELWPRGNFHNPFIIERSGSDLWNAVELERVVDGNDSGAPTHFNLFSQCAAVIKALADDARRNPTLTASSGSALPTLAQQEDRERQIENLAAELDSLAVAMPQGTVTHLQVEERLTALRALGKRPSDSLFNDFAKAFVALDALPREARRSSIHPSERADFEHELRRRQRSPDEFILSTGDPTMTVGSIQPTRDLVIVRHRQSGMARGYNYKTWVMDFIRDLDAGTF